MVDRKSLMLPLVAFGLLYGQVPGFAATPNMSAIDPDHDGTVSLDEAKAAGDAKFATLDADHDGTVDKKEAKGAVSKASYKGADADHDGTIDKAEYESEVEAAFKKADKDNDGTLDAKELKSPAGRKLVNLLQ